MKHSVWLSNMDDPCILNVGSHTADRFVVRIDIICVGFLLVTRSSCNASAEHHIEASVKYKILRMKFKYYEFILWFWLGIEIDGKFRDDYSYLRN